MDYVKQFMTKPEIWRYCAEFGSNIENVSYKTDDRECWLDYNGCGLINIHIMTGSMLTIHPYINRENRLEYNDMLAEFLAWFLDNVPEQIQKINTPIPIFCIGAIQAAFHNKMKVEGVDRMSYLTKNGPVDRVMFGLLRGDI
jgi:hypothetical protein